MDFKATMTNIPYALGYSQQKKKQDRNCIDQSVPENWRVDKLWMILLYEADFNFLNKKLGGFPVTGRKISTGGGRRTKTAVDGEDITEQFVKP